MEVDEPILDATAVLANAASDDDEIQGEQSVVDVGNLAVFSYELVDGESHRETATRLAQLLINKVFTLPVERSDVGPLALLPHPKIAIPREKPIPQAKPETKWEKYAREHGIKKQKKETKIWDPVTQSWKFSHGKKSINKDDDWLIEHKEGSLGDFEDPFIQKKSMKKDRLEKQEKRRLANKRSAALTQAAEAVGGKNAASLVVGNAGPTAGPVSQERLKRAIQMAQRSTRSIGVFDTKRADEPRNKLARKVLPKDSSAERAQSTKIMKKVVRQAAAKQEYDADKMAHTQIREEKNRARVIKDARQEAVDTEKRKRKMR